MKGFTDSLLLPLKQKKGVTLRILKHVIPQVILPSSLSSKGSLLICVAKIREQEKKWELLALSLSLAVVSRQKLLFAATGYCSSSSSPQHQPSAPGSFCTWHSTNNCTVRFCRWLLFKERNTFLCVFPQAAGTHKVPGWLQPPWRYGSERERLSPIAIASDPDQAHRNPSSEKGYRCLLQWGRSVPQSPDQTLWVNNTIQWGLLDIKCARDPDNKAVRSSGDFLEYLQHNLKMHDETWWDCTDLFEFVLEFWGFIQTQDLGDSEACGLKQSQECYVSLQTKGPTAQYLWR